MPTPEPRRRRRAFGTALASRCTAVLATLLLLTASALVGAPAAQALPKGAYWYTLLDLPKAWKISQGAGVTVAVVDSGVQADLGDLRGQVLRGYDLTGSDPGAQREQPATQASQFGHGSDMAVLIAGTGRGAGLVGVAPKAKILPVDAGRSLPDSNIARGVTWAADHGAQVIDLSLGRVGACSDDIRAALKHAYQRDVIVVASAGDTAGPVSTPANCPGALAVSGVDAAIKPWTNSASGPETAFAAPAYGLINELLNNRLDGPSAVDSGTSASAAFVSGTFALLRSRFPSESARQIVTRALYNVHNGVGDQAFGTRVSNALGYGMILPRYALTEAAPAGAKNPIYDQWAKDFAGTASGASSAPLSSAAPTTGPSSGAPPSGSSTPAAASDGGGGISPVLVVVIAVVVIGAVVAVVLVTRRGRRPSGPTGYPPPPPGYGR